MADLTKLAVTALGSAALAAIPASAAAVGETEPNDVFPGQASTVGVTYTGFIDPASSVTGPPVDLFHYTGLPVGGAFDLSFDPELLDFDLLRVGLFTNQTTSPAGIESSGSLVHLQGSIPGSGELTFGVTNPFGEFEAEGYSLVLNVTAAAAVPAPAAIALLAAGLTVVGLDGARRRKRP